MKEDRDTIIFNIRYFSVNGERFEYGETKTIPPCAEDWNRLAAEGIEVIDLGYQTTHPFPKMCKLFGKSYLYWLEIQYRMIKKGFLDLEEIEKWNPGLPKNFLDRFDSKQ